MALGLMALERIVLALARGWYFIQNVANKP